YQSFEFAVKLFEDEYKVPFLAPDVAARMAMINELTTSTLLFLGLATRMTTLPLLGMIAVIQIFVYSTAWPDHLLWGSILVFLLTQGPGPLGRLSHRPVRFEEPRPPAAIGDVARLAGTLPIFRCSARNASRRRTGILQCRSSEI